MTEEISSLKDTAWLAKRLGLSITTIERLRSNNPTALPPHLTIGASIRYEEIIVDEWLTGKLQSKSKEVSHVD